MYGKNPADDLWEQLQKANRVASRILCPRPARPKRRKERPRRLLSMRPEKRPQTIMEQYNRREIMRQPHNRLVWNTLLIDYQTAKWADEQEPRYGQALLTRGL
jgi:hypothetical protein